MRQLSHLVPGDNNLIPFDLWRRETMLKDKEISIILWVVVDVIKKREGAKAAQRRKWKILKIWLQAIEKLS